MVTWIKAHLVDDLSTLRTIGSARLEVPSPQSYGSTRGTSKPSIKGFFILFNLVTRVNY